MDTVAKSGTITAIDTLRIVTIERSSEFQANILYYDAFNTDPFTTRSIVNLTCN